MQNWMHVVLANSHQNFYTATSQKDDNGPG